MKYLILFLLLTFISFQLWAEKNVDSQKFYVDTCIKPSVRDTNVDRNPHGLTLAERIAIKEYTKMAYLEVNPVLRGEKEASACDNAMINTLDSALEKLPVFQGTVYRGMRKKHNPISREDNEPSEFPAYTSTTINKEIALVYARDLLLVINVKNGRDISGYTRVSIGGESEREILLPRGTKLTADDRKTGSLTLSHGREIEVMYASEVLD